MLGVLLVTSERSQHSALTTFTLVPRRSRVIAAEAAAAVTLAVTAAVGCAVAAAVVTAAVGHGASAPAGAWAGAAGAIGGALLFQVLKVLLGLAFGLLFRSSAVAIVVYFVVPTTWSVLIGLISALHGVGHWLDPPTAWNHLAGGTVTATTWAQIALTAAVWIGLPLAAGLWRSPHRPVG